MNVCRICGAALNAKTGNHFAICMTVVNSVASNIESRGYCKDCYFRQVLPALKEFNNMCNMEIMLESGD